MAETIDRSAAAPNRDDVLLIPVATVAVMLGIHVRTVHRLRSAGRLPKPIRFGGSVRWRRRDIEAWIDAECPEMFAVENC